MVACPNTEDPPLNILPAAVLAVVVAGAAVFEAVVEVVDKEREPNNVPAVEAVAVVPKENEDVAFVVGAAVAAVVDTAVVDIVVVVLSKPKVAVAAGFPKTFAAFVVEEETETNENPVLALGPVRFVDSKNDFVSSPVPPAEKIFSVLFESPASLTVGLQMLREPRRESVGLPVAVGVGVLLDADAASAGLACGNSVEVIVTLGAAVDLVEIAVVLPADGLLKLKL